MHLRSQNIAVCKRMYSRSLYKSPLTVILYSRTKAKAFHPTRSAALRTTDRTVNAPPGDRCARSRDGVTLRSRYVRV